MSEPKPVTTNYGEEKVGTSRAPDVSGERASSPPLTAMVTPKGWLNEMLNPPPDDRCMEVLDFVQAEIFIKRIQEDAVATVMLLLTGGRKMPRMQNMTDKPVTQTTKWRFDPWSYLIGTFAQATVGSVIAHLIERYWF